MRTPKQVALSTRDARPELVWRLGVALCSAALYGVMLAAGGGPTPKAVSTLWHLLDESQLEASPLSSLWYLHTQPPLFNALVAGLAQLPWPISASLTWVLGAAHVGTAIVTFDIVRWFGLGRAVAAVGTVVVIGNPNLMSTAFLASSELIVAFLVTLSFWCLIRHLDRPTTRSLLALSGALTAVALTRSAFHPIWVIVMLALVIASRPFPSKRQVAAAVALPLVLIGAIALKNQVNVGTFSVSSWSGFNLQRGVVAAMTPEQVRSAFSDEQQLALAQTPAWLPLDQYPPLGDACVPRHTHPVLTEPFKDPTPPVPTPNFNHECYLPLYQQSAENAKELILRQPGRYLVTRRAPLLASFSTVDVGAGAPGQSMFGNPLPSRTWVDRLYRPLLVPAGVEIDQSDWNLPLFPGAPFPFDVSLTLMLAYAAVAARGSIALVQATLSGLRNRSWTFPPTGLVWAAVLITECMVVVGGAAVEFGENGRFRAVLDPLVCALAWVLLVQVSTWGWRKLEPHTGRFVRDRQTRS